MFSAHTRGLCLGMVARRSFGSLEAHNIPSGRSAKLGCSMADFADFFRDLGLDPHVAASHDVDTVRKKFRLTLRDAELRRIQMLTHEMERFEQWHAARPQPFSAFPRGDPAHTGTSSRRSAGYAKSVPSPASPPPRAPGTVGGGRASGSTPQTLPKARTTLRPPGTAGGATAPGSAPRPRGPAAAAKPAAAPRSPDPAAADPAVAARPRAPRSPDTAAADPAAARSAPGPRAGPAPRAKSESDHQASESPPASSTPSERSPTSFSNESANDAPCSNEPHCKNWNKRHGDLTEERKLEYKFLYAASAGCVQCMQYYASLPDFNVRCESSEMNARQWAEDADQLSPQVEDLLRRLGL